MLIKAKLAIGSLCLGLGLGAVGVGAVSSARQAQDPAWPFDEITLTAPDGSITAKFVSIGATLTEVWVRDKNNELRDVVLGYDDNSKLASDPDHPYFNAIVGRYANRLKNGTFTIPITKNPTRGAQGVYTIPTNDQNGQVTLHGGIIGWDRRNWTVVERTATSVTYRHVDEGHENWPGTVTTLATHTVSNNGVLQTVLKATASVLTPIMLTQHTYWNLDGFKDLKVDKDVFDHQLQVSSSRVIDLDTNRVPNGKFVNVVGTPFDFKKATKIGARWNRTKGLCGGDCQGYDACWIYDKIPADAQPKASIWSDRSGIRMDMYTDQDALQIYTSNWLNTPRKKAHGGPTYKYDKQSAVALEHHSYVDAVHNPEWNIDQIYGPERSYEWSATHKFSTVGKPKPLA